MGRKEGKVGCLCGPSKQAGKSWSGWTVHGMKTRRPQAALVTGASCQPNSLPSVHRPAAGTCQAILSKQREKLGQDEALHPGAMEGTRTGSLQKTWSAEPGWARRQAPGMERTGNGKQRDWPGSTAKLLCPPVPSHGVEPELPLSPHHGRETWRGRCTFPAGLEDLPQWG